MFIVETVSETCLIIFEDVVCGATELYYIIQRGGSLILCTFRVCILFETGFHLSASA